MDDGEEEWTIGDEAFPDAKPSRSKPHNIYVHVSYAVVQLLYKWIVSDSRYDCFGDSGTSWGAYVITISKCCHCLPQQSITNSPIHVNITSIIGQ